MQLRRCITRGVRNYSHAPIFNLLRVRVISVERVLEMSERVTYSMVSQYSTNSSRSLHSLSSPSRTTSRNSFIGAAAAISRGMHCERPRTRLSPSCTHITPLALTTHLTPLTSHTHHSPLALTTHLSHSPLALTSHLSLTLTSRCLAAPPNPQPATHHLRTRNTIQTHNTCAANSRSLAPAILAPFARR
jgi:hypothetical protein